VNSQSSFTSIASYRVSGAPNYNAPGNESFWNEVSWTNVPLAASVSPGGGHTPNVLAKSANDGFYIYVLFRWNDSQGPSFGSSSELYRSSNGSLVELTPESTANVTQLFYNSTYYYPDRMAMLWFVADTSERQQSPAMQLGSNGAITGGAADIWHWQSNPTDNNPSDTDFPGGYTDPSGRPIFPPDNLSFAEDDYSNSTGFYVIAGSFGSDSPNLNPYADPYIVNVGSYFSNVSKTWTVEMIRSFTTNAPKYRVQLATGRSYYVAFAVWNGKLGESADIKSVSQWYNFTISDQTPTPPSAISTPVTAVGEISLETAAVVGFGMLVAGFLMGVAVIARSSLRKSRSVLVY
jgi:cytochrome b558/566 subunit A